MKSSSSYGRVRGTNGLKGERDRKDLSKRFVELSGKRGVNMRMHEQVALLAGATNEDALEFLNHYHEEYLNEWLESKEENPKMPLELMVVQLLRELYLMNLELSTTLKDLQASLERAFGDRDG